jgi:YHS domain-containing protein
MRRHPLFHFAFCILHSAFIVSCARTPAPAPTQPPRQQAMSAEVRTIQNVDPGPPVMDPPPMLQDEAPPPRPKRLPWEPLQEIVLTPEDEKVRASLPFSPAIAMDPVDGSKISIRAATPMLEYKGRIYYFQSEANKRSFAASPDQYLTGRFTRL